MKNIVLFLYGVIFSIPLFLILSFISLPLSKPAFADYFLIKDHINKKSTHPRILIMSASDGIYGIDGKSIATQIQISPINYSIFFGTGIALEYRIGKIIDAIQTNDMILLPLNFNFYFEKKPDKDYSFLQNILAWGERKYKQQLFNQPIKLLKTLSKSPTSFLITGIFYRLHNLFKNPKSLISYLEKQWEHNSLHPFQVSVKSLDQYGGFNTHTGSLLPSNASPKYLENDFYLSSYFIEQIQKLQKIAKEKNATLIFTYPPTIKNPNFNLDIPSHLKRIEKLKKQLAQIQIYLVGDPKAFQYPISMFYDTRWHLNHNGAKQYTQEIINVIKNLIPKNEI